MAKSFPNLIWKKEKNLSLHIQEDQEILSRINSKITTRYKVKLSIDRDNHKISFKKGSACKRHP